LARLELERQFGDETDAWDAADKARRTADGEGRPWTEEEVDMLRQWKDRRGNQIAEDGMEVDG
jgi:hypothetical protein